jgi:hypothetical protein
MTDPWAPPPDPFDSNRLAEQAWALQCEQRRLAARPIWQKAYDALADAIVRHRIGLVAVGVLVGIIVVWYCIALATR